MSGDELPEAGRGLVFRVCRTGHHRPNNPYPKQHHVASPDGHWIKSPDGWMPSPRRIKIKSMMYFTRMCGRLVSTDSQYHSGQSSLLLEVTRDFVSRENICSLCDFPAAQALNKFCSELTLCFGVAETCHGCRQYKKYWYWWHLL